MANADRIRLLVLCGGRSAEHEVSVLSARSMLPHVDRERYDVTLVGIGRDGDWRLIDESSNVLASGEIASDASPRVFVDQGHGARLLVESASGVSGLGVDVVFPLLHGPHGEDGTVQGLLELAGIATVGCGTAASAVGMDKELAKRLFKAEGLAQVDHMVVRRERWERRPDPVLVEIEGRLDYPVYVKPARMGSSVGVSRAEDRDALVAALDAAATYDSKLIVEAAAVGCREIECAVLGNECPEASVPGEIVPCNAFYDYDAKYLAAGSELRIPAPLSAAAAARVQAEAVAAFRAIDGSGLARVDFFVSADDESVLINEINTMPGFTPISMYPKLWAASGVPYPALIDRLVDLALERHGTEARNRLSR